MKRSIVLFVLLSAFVVGVCMVNAACGASLSRTESDDVLDGIQKKLSGYEQLLCSKYCSSAR